MTHWTADIEHSEIRFKVSHLNLVHTTGKFGDFQVDMQVNTDFSQANFSVEIAVNSINTLNAIRDERLLSADFFNAEKFPKLRFTSTNWEKRDTKTYVLTGNFELLGVVKPVQCTAVFSGRATDPYSGEVKLGITLTGEIDRRDFGMDFNLPLETGGLAIGNRIYIAAELEMKPKAK